MKPNGFSFFNKEDGIIEDLNTAASQQRQYLQNYLKGFITPGFVPADNDLVGFDFQTSDFVMSQGTDIHHLNMSVVADTVMAIDTTGQVITVDTNTPWTIAPTPSQSSGNLNIDLSNGGAFSIVPPYDRWIWIKFKEIRSETVNDTRVDYDGVTQYPVKNIGYEIIITNTNVNPDPTALFVVHVNVDTNQTYYTEPSIAFPTDPIRLKASVKDSAVWALLESVTFKPTTYQDGTAGNPKRYSLKDHINSVGTGLVSANNPHGIAPKDIPTYDSNELSVQHNIIRNGFISLGYSPLDPIVTLWNSPSPVAAIPSGTYSVLFNGLKYEISELPGYNSSTGRVEIPFNATLFPTSGYYKINIPSGSLTPTFVATYVGDLVNMYGDIIYGYPNSNEVIAGWLYWDADVGELRKTNKAFNANGTHGIGYPTVGGLNKIHISTEASMASIPGRNLLMLPDSLTETFTSASTASQYVPGMRIDGLSGTETATVIISNSVTIDVTISCTSPKTFSINLPLINSSSWKYVMPRINSKFIWRLTTNATNVYRSVVNLGGIAVDMPCTTSDQQIVVVAYTANYINFSITCQAAGTYAFRILNLSVNEGSEIPSGAFQINHVPASQVVFNNNFARYGLPPVLQEFRPTVHNKNMDRIIYKTPQTPTMKQTSDTTQNSNLNFATYGTGIDNFSNVMIDDTKMNNIEIWPVQGLMHEVPATGLYNCVFQYDNTKYELVSANMNWMPGDYTPVTPDIVKDWLRFGGSDFSYYVTLADSTGAAILNKHIYCIGTVMMRRKAV